MADPRYAHARPAPLDPSANAIYSHSRSRTTSSNVFPNNPYSPAPVHMGGQYGQPNLVQPQPQHQRRTPSVNTFSTISSGGGMAPPATYRTSPTNDIRRSTSSRSGGAPGSPQTSQPSSYVALLRRQKATVWCDRAQYEDPRLLAQQRAAKMRANLEVVGTNSGLGLGPGSGRTSTGLSAGGKIGAKIRHHGKPAVVNYGADNNYIGVAGVPLRLSATEVEGEDSDEDEIATQRLQHRRTGSSSRSSTASGRKAMGYRSSGGLGGSNSLKKWSPGDTPERSGSLVEDKLAELNLGGNGGDDSASGKARSFASGSSGERLDSVPDLNANPPSRLAGNSAQHAAVTREKSVKSVDDLRRRGSVDERTMTLTTGRLYIANPD